MASPDFSEDVFGRHSRVFQNYRAGRAALDAHLLLFGAGAHTRKGTLDEERREFFPADFGENGEQVRPVPVGDPHLLAVEKVDLARGVQVSAGAGGEGVATGMRFAQAIRTHPLAAGQLRQILFLLLFAPEVDDRQGADGAVSAKGAGERRIFGDVLGDKEAVTLSI